MEHVARPGAEEQIDNEKYEYKDRQWYLYEPGGPLESRSLAWYLKRLNDIRSWHPALRWLRNLRFHAADDENVIVFSKSRVVDRATGERDTVLVIANLDPHATRETACTSTWRRWAWRRGRRSTRTTTSPTRPGTGARTTS